MSIINRHVSGPSYGVDPVALDLRSALRPGAMPPLSPAPTASGPHGQALDIDRLYPSLRPTRPRQVVRLRRLRRLIVAMLSNATRPLIRT